MKKILIIILTLLLCTGCFDYKEINDLAIINAIGVDYENDECIKSFYKIQEFYIP